MKRPGYILSCDRCGKEVFLSLIEEHERSMDGGYTRFMERKFEDWPEGWSTYYIGEVGHHGTYILCPECSRRFEELSGRFINQALEGQDEGK